MLYGYFDLPWWGYLLVGAGLTHLTIVSVTLYLHRAQAHRALTLHPLASHLFRFWLWLTTGMITREWVAVHRRHHARCDSDGDPHSPQLEGIAAVLWRGAELYGVAARDTELLRRYGQGTPDDWIERQLYSRHSLLGIGLMLLLDLACFGVIGLTLWAVQMIWIPFWAAGVVNGLGHWSGYRNFETPDASRNLFPLALLIGGEELHNNHHAAPGSARLSYRWFELDIGWVYIRLLQGLRLAQVKRAGLIGQQELLATRLQVLRLYGRQVLLPILQQESRHCAGAVKRRLLQNRWLLLRERTMLNSQQQARVQHSLALSQVVATVYEFQNRLQALWQLPRSTEHWLSALHEWCRDARHSDIDCLAEFAERLLRAQAVALK